MQTKSGRRGSMPACTECKRRKLRCSKELPACRECRRLDQLENLLRKLDEKTAPIVESYNQSRFGSHWSHSNESPATTSDSLVSIVADPNQSTGWSRNPLKRPRESLNRCGHGNGKKRRPDPQNHFSWGQFILGPDLEDNTCSTGLDGLLKLIVDAYFRHVHPWIPMIHEATFKDLISKEVHTPDSEAILRAILVVGFRFLEPEVNVNPNQVDHLVRNSRDWVILHATSGLSVGNLQALVIIAFDDIGNGNTNKAWPIIGSLTRTVEYLQLSIENDDEEEQPLLKPCPLLPKPKRWTETEERRRVFWNVFNLDRFCSVLTGWNTSLTSDDVRRCLPVDGILWRTGEAVQTPYFGIWDKSAGKIGNSIAFLPDNYTSPTQTTNEVIQSPDIHAEPKQHLETSTIGAFAYCIEATESMSRVTTYFLQQKVDFKDEKQIASWLTRFKELDLRLVQWKKFLPQKWKDTNISRKPTEIIMDPNLTLAHITHNASMILLHQLIAYPGKDWLWAKKLPSQWSADTCQAAAVETSSICQNYLANPTRNQIVHSQLIFCVFISARILLVHWRYYPNTELNPAFPRLIHTLNTISSRRKSRPYLGVQSSSDLASEYSDVLRRLENKCKNDSSFSLDVLGYVNDLGPNSNDNKCDENKRENAQAHLSPRRNDVDEERISDGDENQSESDNGHQVPASWARIGDKVTYANQEILAADSLTAMQMQPSIPIELTQSPSIPQIHHQNQFDNQNSPHLSLPSNPSIFYGSVSMGLDPSQQTASIFASTAEFEDFNSLAQISFDQQYMEMDRVISFDDGMFSASMDWWHGNQEQF